MFFLAGHGDDFIVICLKIVSIIIFLYFCSMNNTALVLLGHGSSKHASSSIPCRLHADTIRRMGVFKEVHCGFLKEDPLIEKLPRARGC